MYMYFVRRSGLASGLRRLVMARAVLLASALLGTPVLAQSVPPTVPDYVFSVPELPGKAASFALKDTATFTYVTQVGKKPLLLPLPKKLTLANTLLVLRAGKSLKADDAVLIQRALVAWDSARADIGFTVTKSGLRYKITSKGSGKLPEAGKQVTVHYRGYLASGKEFDSSFKRGQPLSFPLGQRQVIAGWDEGLLLFPVGSKGTLKVPPGLGYGAREIPNMIPANSTLYFDIEVVAAD
jgi:FKBP-type peptidyl-prolyl cis-trans isomerase